MLDLRRILIMIDFAYVLGQIAFFTLCVLYTIAWERI